ncbi:MAG TPA: VWA domain-containing protein [Lutibacter sp.]|nr:VWA domain-containing protein [Lutibacter sp.]
MPNNFEFLHPHFLWLFALVPLLVFWYFWVGSSSSKASLKMGSSKALRMTSSLRAKLHIILPILRLLAISTLIIALARPRTHSVSKKTKTNKGIDIVMAIDVSASMLAKDLRPNRLEALKKVATRFVNQRPNDRIGIVAYAGESFTKTPVTSDKDIVAKSINDLKWGDLEGGTAIGMGLGSAINRIKDSKAKSKIIILLTDGVNNTGFVDPFTAAEIAKDLEIKVYTIGIGTNGTAQMPYAKNRDGSLSFRSMQVEIDEVLLKKIAKETNGKYFRATSNTKLKSIYEEINKMEKTEVEEFKYYNYNEMYRFWVYLAGLFLLLEILLRFTVFKGFV